MSESWRDSQATLVMAGARIEKDQGTHEPEVTQTPPALDNNVRAHGISSADGPVWLTANSGACFHNAKDCSVGLSWNVFRLAQGGTCL